MNSSMATSACGHKTKELMQVVRQQNHFLNVVSHELRTPLNNSLEMLNQLSATQLDEDQAELFQDLDKANIDVTLVRKNADGLRR